MTTQGDSARELVEQLIAHAAQDKSSSAVDTGAVISAYQRVSGELTRWVGGDGARALLMRALSRAQASHPGLSGIAIASHSRPVLEGLSVGITSNGNAAIEAGLESMLVTLFELLSRLLGDDLAVKLAEQSMSAGVTTTERNEDEEHSNA